MSILLYFLGVISRGTRSLFIGLRSKDSPSIIKVSLVHPRTGTRLKRISILIPIPCLYLTVSTNQSPFCNWKRQRLVRLEDSRLNCRRNTIYGGADGGKKRVAILPPRRCNFDIPSFSEGKYANDL